MQWREWTWNGKKSCSWLILCLYIFKAKKQWFCLSRIILIVKYVSSGGEISTLLKHGGIPQANKRCPLNSHHHRRLHNYSLMSLLKTQGISLRMSLWVVWDDPGLYYIVASRVFYHLFFNISLGESPHFGNKGEPSFKKKSDFYCSSKSIITSLLPPDPVFFFSGWYRSSHFKLKCALS